MEGLSRAGGGGACGRRGRSGAAPSAGRDGAAAGLSGQGRRPSEHGSGGAENPQAGGGAPLGAGAAKILSPEGRPLSGVAGVKKGRAKSSTWNRCKAL